MTGGKEDPACVLWISGLQVWRIYKNLCRWGNLIRISLSRAGTGQRSRGMIIYIPREQVRGGFQKRLFPENGRWHGIKIMVLFNGRPKE